MKELDNWKTKVCVLRRELETKQSYADKLTYLLRQRSERIDELNSKLAQVREQNRRLDQENEHLAEMIRFTSSRRKTAPCRFSNSRFSKQTLVLK